MTRRLTIFSRLILGCLAIFLIMGSVTFYAVAKLHQMNRETSTLFTTDEQLMDIKKRLTDSMLSQLEYEKKYSIAKDPVFRDQFLVAGNEFVRSLNRAESIIAAFPKREFLDRVEGHYAQYQALIREEDGLPDPGRAHSKWYYEQRKGRLVGDILEDLGGLETACREDMHIRLNMLHEAAGSAHRFAVVMLTVAFVLVIVTSVLGARDITKPLMILIEKTKAISKGTFEGDLDVSSLPKCRNLRRL